jgi:hypothetical protein
VWIIRTSAWSRSRAAAAVGAVDWPAGVVVVTG